MLSLYDSKKSIYAFYKLINKKKYQIVKKKFFYIRPSHEIRYHLKTLESKIISNIPIIREFLITGTVFLISKEKI